MSKSPSRKDVGTMDDVFASATPPSAGEQAAQPPAKRPDARNLHKTGRTHQFATRIKEETHDKMYEIVKREKEAGNARFTLAELIELAIDAYEREQGH